MIEVKDLISILNWMLKDDVSIEEYSDDAFTYRLFYEIYQQVPYVMYFFDGIDDEDEIDGEFDLKETYNNIINSTNCLVYPWKGNKLLIGDGWMTFKGTIFNIKNEQISPFSYLVTYAISPSRDFFSYHVSKPL